MSPFTLPSFFHRGNGAQREFLAFVSTMNFSAFRGLVLDLIDDLIGDFD